MSLKRYENLSNLTSIFYFNDRRRVLFVNGVSSAAAFLVCGSNCMSGDMHAPRVPLYSRLARSLCLHLRNCHGDHFPATEIFFSLSPLEEMIRGEEDGKPECSIIASVNWLCASSASLRGIGGPASCHIHTRGEGGTERRPLCDDDSPTLARKPLDFLRSL